MLRPLEDVLTLLTSAGFTGVDALHIYRVLFGYLHGHILDELQEIIERPEETDHVLRLGLHRLAITEFPRLRALAPALATYDGAAELDRGLDLLLPGLTATLTGRDGQTATVCDAMPLVDSPHRPATTQRRIATEPRAPGETTWPESSELMYCTHIESSTAQWTETRWSEPQLAPTARAAPHDVVRSTHKV